MKKEYLYAGVSIFLWSTTATVTKLLLGTLNSMQILTISSLVAFLFLLILNIIKKNLKELKKYKLKDYLQISIIGILGTFLYKLFLFLGIDTLSASQAFIINYTWPIMIVIFACIILKEKITLKKIIAIILSFIGVVIVTSNGNILGIKYNLTGTIFCLLGSISYGIFSVLNKYKNYNKYVSMMLYYLVSFIISILYTIITKDFFEVSITQLLGLIWTGVFTSAIAFTSWVLALDNGDTVKISNLAYITPFISLIWNYLILKEQFSIYSIIGLIVIITGIFIQIKKRTNIKKIENQSQD